MSPDSMAVGANKITFRNLSLHGFETITPRRIAYIESLLLAWSMIEFHNVWRPGLLAVHARNRLQIVEILSNLTVLLVAITLTVSLYLDIRPTQPSLTSSIHGPQTHQALMGGIVSATSVTFTSAWKGRVVGSVDGIFGHGILPKNQLFFVKRGSKRDRK